MPFDDPPETPAPEDRPPLARMLALALTLAGLVCGSCSRQPLPSYNVLFVSVDDLRPELGCYGAAGMVTPHIDRLAGQGTLFTRAYCQDAVCNPSRVSLLTGLRPETTGIYDLRTYFRDVLPDVVTLPQLFRLHGAHTESIGKTFHTGHHNRDDPKSWSRIRKFPGVDKLYRPGGPWASIVAEDDELREGMIARGAIDLLREMGERRFFLAVGFHQPHLPFVSPKGYWDLYADEEVPLPQSSDMPFGAPAYAGNGSVEIRTFEGVPAEGPLGDDLTRDLVHAYRASVSYVDRCVGRMLDELDRLGLRERTIVVLWSDHGLHLGEKEHWGKFSPWEESTRVPLLISGPGVPKGVVCDAPVSLMDLYPTVVELAGLPAPTLRAGRSLVPWMEDPAREREEPALTSVGQGSHTVRSRDWRYVRWADGSEELYDHRVDPHEWTNLAGRAEHAAVQRELAGWIPAKSAAERGED